MLAQSGSCLSFCSCATSMSVPQSVSTHQLQWPPCKQSITLQSSARKGASWRVRTKYSSLTGSCLDNLSASITLIGVIPMPPATSRTPPLDWLAAKSSVKSPSIPLNMMVLPGRMLSNSHCDTTPACIRQHHLERTSGVSWKDQLPNSVLHSSQFP